MKNNTTNTTDKNLRKFGKAFDSSFYLLPEEELRRKVTNRVVTYYNENPSSVKKDGVRNLVIKKIDRIGFAESSGYRYIQGEVQDLDDGGTVKFRTLHVAGIVKVKGKISTAINLAKSVF